MLALDGEAPRTQLPGFPRENKKGSTAVDVRAIAVHLDGQSGAELASPFAFDMESRQVATDLDTERNEAAAVPALLS